MTMNARELQHFYQLRCCRRAQWEIQVMAREMLKLAYQVAPSVFQGLYQKFIVEGAANG